MKSRNLPITTVVKALLYLLIPAHLFADQPADTASIKWLSPTECTQTALFTVQPEQKLFADVDQGNVHISRWDQPKAELVVRHKGKDAADVVKHHQITLEQSDSEVRLIAKSDATLPNHPQAMCRWKSPPNQKPIAPVKVPRAT